MNRCYFSFALALAIVPLAIAQPPQPIPAKLPTGEATLADVLAALKQTGNAVTDRRSPADNVKLSLPIKMGDFWPTLDALGEKTGIAFSASQPDGGVALIDRPYRKLKTSYSSVFRFAVTRIQLTRDDDTQTHSCTVALDIAWEPRFQPFFLNLDRAAVAFAPDAKGNIVTDTIPRHTRGSVAGSTTTEVELRMKAPDRSAPAIASLTGSVEVVGPPKMLEFAFSKLAPIKKADTAAMRSLEEEGVKVNLTYAELGPTRWSVDVEMTYPPDALAPFESFQADAWRANNRVWLSWLDPRTKQARQLAHVSQSTQTVKVGTKIRYHFEPRDEAPLPPRGTEVTLTYRTPNRVVAFAVPFAFRDLPLP